MEKDKPDMEKVTTEDPLLRSPAQRAEATQIYEQAERCTRAKWSKKLSQYRADSIEWALAGGFVGALCSFVATIGIVVALQ